MFAFVTPGSPLKRHPTAHLFLCSASHACRRLVFSHTPRVAARTAGVLILSLLLGHSVDAQTILGSMGDYAVMAGGTVTINGGTNTAITGSLGAIGSIAGPGSNYTITNGTLATTTTANQTDFTRAFGGLAAMPATANLTGLVLGTTAGALVLAPGVYHFDSTAQLTGTLVLDAQNLSNAVWVFQIGSTLTTAAASSITFINLAANSAVNDGVFWQVGSTTTLGADSIFEGNILGGTTLSFGANVRMSDGRALTGFNAITLDGDIIDFGGANAGYSGGLTFNDSGNSISAIPEPSTYAFVTALAALGLALRRRRHATS